MKSQISLNQTKTVSIEKPEILKKTIPLLVKEKVFLYDLYDIPHYVLSNSDEK